MSQENLFVIPPIGAAELADGWRTETLIYSAVPRPRPKFKGALSARQLFGASGGESRVTTRLKADVMELTVRHELAGAPLLEQLKADVQQGVMRPRELLRQLGPTDALARDERVRFDRNPLGLPEACYPEVMLPFLMRGQPLDGQRRSVWSWSNDRFVARVYYEFRKTVSLTVPAGTFSAALVWMYPDLNDWISLGGVVTRLAKPLLPRYDIWIERGPRRRVLRFEGPYGPPGAPEVVLALRR